MAMRKSLLSLLLSFVFIPALVSSAVAQTPDDVVEKHLAAMGGRDALTKITSRRSVGTISLSTPNGDLTGPIEIDNKAPNKVRVAIELDLSAMGVADKMSIEQKFDGTNGVVLNSVQGDTEMSGSQLENLRNNMFPSALLAVKAAGTKLELLPKEQVNGTEAIVLRVTPKVGPTVKIYLDASTYLIVRTVVTVNSPQMGGDIEQTSTLSDYRTVDGVKVPFQIVNSTPLQTGTLKFTKIEHNVALDDALFVAKR
jgi:hypothetical protein